MAAAMVLAAVDGAQAGDCEGCSDAPCNDADGAGLCCADLTGDGQVTEADLDLFLAALEQECGGECGCIADLNHDGVVDECDTCIMEHEYRNCSDGYPPLLLETWDPLCYCNDPNCPTDPNDCCPPHCTPCLADRGCLPLDSTSMAFSDLDGDGWVDALVWSEDPLSDSRRRILERLRLGQ